MAKRAVSEVRGEIPVHSGSKKRDAYGAMEMEVYRCPLCCGKLSSGTAAKASGGRNIDAALDCENCSKSYPVSGRIIHFIRQEEVKGSDAVFERLYRHWARLYDLTVKVWSYFLYGGETAWRGELMSNLEISRGDRVLEVSIGTGGNLPYIGSFGCDLDIYGLDITLGMLRKCRKNLDKWNLEAELCLGNAAYLPYGNDCFDCVYHVGGINGFSEKERAISEMIRVAKPGTRIVISDETEKMIYAGLFARMGRPEVDDFIKKHVLNKSYLKELTSDDLRAPVEHVPAGMEEVDVKPACKGTMYVLSFRKPV
jgi:ubiquinone/menaquinone biosynthesis C-methylase UbiE